VSTCFGAGAFVSTILPDSSRICVTTRGSSPKNDPSIR